MAAATLLWVRRLLLSALGLLSVLSFAGAVLAGHTLGAVAWVLCTLLVLVLCAVLFSERFLAAPVKVVSELSGLLANLPVSVQWLIDLLVDKKDGIIPPTEANALARAILEKQLMEATPLSATGGPGV